MFDYNVGLNEIVQILVRKKITEPSPKKTPRKEEISTDKENVEVSRYDACNNLKLIYIKYFTLIDYCDTHLLMVSSAQC